LEIIKHTTKPRIKLLANFYYQERSLPYRVASVGFYNLKNPDFIAHIQKAGIVIYKWIEAAGNFTNSPGTPIFHFKMNRPAKMFFNCPVGNGLGKII